MIESRYYKISATRYTRHALGIWIGRWWWAILLPLCLLLIMGTHDARYFIIAMAAILIIYPGLMMMVYYNHALRPQAALSVIPHKVSIDDRELTITYQPSDEYRTPQPRVIPLTGISSAEDTGQSILIHLKSGKYDSIEVPIYALDATDIPAALALLRSQDKLP